MAKNIEPKLKKIGDYLHLIVILYLQSPNIRDHILGVSLTVISYGRIFLISWIVGERIIISSEQL